MSAISPNLAVEQACSLVPPLWTLRNFVAVNPYLGLTQKPFGEAIAEADRLKHADSLLSLAEYKTLFDSGRISQADLDTALAEGPTALHRPDLAEISADALRESLFAGGHTSQRVFAYSELVDHSQGTEWSMIIVDEIAKWCAGRFDRGQTSWQQPHLDLPIYQAWKALAEIDRTLEVQGLDGFCDFVRSLPADPEACIDQLVKELGIPEADLGDYLARSLATVSGWAGHLQYRVRQAGMEGRETHEKMSDLLAIRLAHDAAVHRNLSNESGLGTWSEAKTFALGTEAESEAPNEGGKLTEIEVRHLWQLGYEAGYRRKLIEQVVHKSDADALPAAEGDPRLQVAFCIDVRSEVYRRQLEKQNSEVRTIGFAGFFGLPIESIQSGDAAGEARCPALLSPAYVIPPKTDHDPIAIRSRRRRDQYHTLVKQLRLSSVGAFPFVETIGQFFGLRLMTESLGLTRPGPDSRLLPEPKTGSFAPVVAAELAEENDQALALPDRIAAAASILTNMGITKDLAPYILLCGHGSTTTNNPYGSGLDCGACGGYAGDINARAAAALLNDPAVRAALPEQGHSVPTETRFLAGLHDTTTDEITIYDTDDVPLKDLQWIREVLKKASASTRVERALRLGGPAGLSAEDLVQQRSQDWSELRPEWGLAGNAAFIAAPRERTRGLDLGGRTFLHDYYADRDPENGVLELVLTAPLVVASWINLQYYGSTVDNEAFGSGSKTIHNVVGRHGVISGNGGDLRVGLPFQSVHDGDQTAHEPVRLTALIEASQEAISGIVEKHDGLRELIENQWIHLISIDPGSGECARLTSDGFQRI